MSRHRKISHKKFEKQVEWDTHLPAHFWFAIYVFVVAIFAVLTLCMLVGDETGWQVGTDGIRQFCDRLINPAACYENVFILSVLVALLVASSFWIFWDIRIKRKVYYVEVKE